jgi:O-antigen/teichoic acid export membrane protein
MTAKEPQSSLTHRTVGGMVWAAWGNGAVALLKAVVLVLLTRLLSPADFGIVSAALVVINFSLNFSQLGLGPALVQRPVLEPRHISTAFVASTIFGFLMAGAIWSAAPWIAQFFRMEHLESVVRWLALVFPIAGLATAPESLLQRELRFRLIANRDVLAYGLGYGAVGVGLALMGFGVWSLVVAQLAQVVLRTAILLWVSPPLFRDRPGWGSFLELIHYGMGQSVARVGVILANQTDNLVVGRWLGAVALGQYSRAYQLMALPTSLIGDVLDKVLFPTMARVQNDARRLGSAYLQGTAFLALITLPAGIVAALLAPDLVPLLFGQRWVGLVPPFQVLALGMMFRTCYRMSDSLSRATGKVYRRAWRQWLFAGLVFLGAWVGHFQGLTAVALGVLFAFFINYLSMAQLSLSVTQISWSHFVRAQLPAVWLGLVVGAATLAATTGVRYLGLSHFLGLLAGTLAAVGSALLAVWLIPRLALGEYGMQVTSTLRTYLHARVHPLGARGSR